MDYVIYIADTETTGLDSRINDVIEISMFRLTDGVQKTWSLKPTNPNNINLDSLRVNGHKIEELRHETRAGRERYLDPIKTIVEIENWIAEDGVPAENRVMCGHNIAFDHDMLKQLWTKCAAADSFPFGRRTMDTMGIEFFLDWCLGKLGEGYSLNNLVKKYGIKNEKAHTAEADVKATKDVFEKQVEFFKKVLNA
jgi:DNA polymerase III alpha subunit (gram-positive type)